MSVALPSFIDRDPQVITRELVAAWEGATGRPLHPAQVERLLIDIIAYREVLVRESFQDAAQQNLLAWARGLALDAMGDFRGVGRLGPKPALTTHRFQLAATSPTDTLIDTSARVGTSDGKVVFKPSQAGVIAAGSLMVDLATEALELGPDANGYTPGQISRLLTPIAGVESATNVTVSADGALAESDDHYRERIRLAPAARAGGATADYYAFWASSVSQAVREVRVIAASGGRVDVYVLAQDKDGQPVMPSGELIDQVQVTLSSGAVRSISDLVVVMAPTRVPWTLDAEVTLLREAGQASTQAAVEAAAASVLADRRSRLGLDLVSLAIRARLLVAGVYDVQISSPAQRVLEPHEWADGELGTLAFVGVADG